VFQFPIFLWAAAAAVLPLILHMMQRRRIVRVPFSTVRFLLMAQKRASKRIRLENLLLWIMRTLLMLLIALAFAVPMLRTKSFGNILGRAERDVALVIDGSYSMNYSVGKETVWERSLRCAENIVNGLDDGDRVCIYLAHDDVTPVIEQLTRDRDFALAQIRSLQAGTSSSDLCPAVIAANDALLQEERRREREIHIITDGQSLPWAGFARRDAEAQDNPQPADPDAAEGEGVEAAAVSGTRSLDLWQPEEIDKNTAFFVTLAGPPEPENTAPLEIELEPPLIMSDMPSKLRVLLGFSGPPRDTSVSVFIDNEEVQRRAVIQDPQGTESLLFTLPPLPAGVHPARVETPPDGLADDNTFHFLMRVKERLPCLCVGNRDDTFFLLKALGVQTEAGSVIAVTDVAPAGLEKEDLTIYSSVFLCNALPLPGQLILKLEDYVRNGGLLAIFPGDRGTLQDYEPWSCLPGLPSDIDELPLNARKRILRWVKPQHPLFRALQINPGTTPVVTIQRELLWGELHKTAEPLIFAGSDNPFLLSRPFGKGHVLLFSVSADRTWGNLPLSPFFLPLVHQTVHFGAGIAGAEAYLNTTPRLDLSRHLPQMNPTASLLDPVGDPVTVRSTVVEARTILQAENVTAPGIYRLASDGPDAAQAALAINLNRNESNLARLKKEDVPGMIGTRAVNVAESLEDLQRLIDEYRIGRTLGEQVLWLAFLLGVVELVYANRKSKAATPLSDVLGVNPAGKVKTHNEAAED